MLWLNASVFITYALLQKALTVTVYCPGEPTEAVKDMDMSSFTLLIILTKKN